MEDFWNEGALAPSPLSTTYAQNKPNPPSKYH